MPATEDGANRLLNFFLYGMIRASESLGNPALFMRSVIHARGDAPGPARSGLRSEAQPVRTTVSDHPHALPLEGFLMETKKMETTKIRTYIDGLDEVLGGGLPAGHVVLVSGLPGTMKSTL